ILRTNVSLYGLEAKLFQHALSNRNGSATLTVYPKWSTMSGLYANAEEEERLTRQVLNAQSALLAQYADELVEGKFNSESTSCRLRRLSDLILENGIGQIDLLKIDAEKSEFDILSGIEAEDWSKIKQIVMEVHDIDGRLDQTADLLKRHGYDLVVEQDALFK